MTTNNPPDIANIPDFDFIAKNTAPKKQLVEMPQLPVVAETDRYKSASAFMRALANEAMSWNEQLPDNFQPEILALLPGGLQIKVNVLSQVSFHGIRIDGSLNGSPCSLLGHQNTVQILCYGKEILPDDPKRPIGFIWDEDSVEV